MVGHAAGDRAHRRRARRTTARAPAFRRRRAADTTDTAARAAAPIAIFSSSRSALPRSSWPTSAGIERAPALVEQQRILARPLRDDALGQAGHEHDAERAAARLMRRADEHAAVAARRRLPVERDQAVVQHVARLLERDRTDLGHRPQLGERLQHARRPRAAPRVASALKRSSHSPQVAALRPRRPARRRSAARTARRCARLREVALEPRDARRLGLLALQLVDAVAVVGGQAVEPAPPARLAVLRACGRRPPPTRRSALPTSTASAACRRRSPRRRNRSAGGRARALLGIVRRRPGSAIGRANTSSRGTTIGGGAIDGAARAPRPAAPGRATGIRRTAWPTALDGARQQRDERAAGGIRAARAAIEVHRHAAARARVLEQPEILLRRAQEHRHLVERHAARRPRRGRGGRSRPLRALRPAPRTARRRRRARARPAARSGTRTGAGTPDRVAVRSLQSTRLLDDAAERDSASSANVSPSGTVASTSGDRAISAATNSCSARESSGTSSSSDRQSAPSARARRGTRRRRAGTAPRDRRRSTRSSSASTRASRMLRSPVHPASRSAPGPTSVRRPSPRALAADAGEAQLVDASARAPSEIRASARPARSRPARRRPAPRTPRARLSLPRRPASRARVAPPSGCAAAARAASSVRLKRVMPNVAPAWRATARARSSAAPRDAPTMISSLSGGRPPRNSRAAASRAAADVEVMMRTIRTPSGRLAGHSGAARLRRAEVRS